MTKPQASVRTSDNIRSGLKSLRVSLHMNWREFAAYLEKEHGVKVPAGSLCTFVKDGTLSPEYFHYFGLPAIGSAPVCSVHHVVHCYDCAVETVKAKRPKKTGWKSLFDIPHEGKNSELAKMVTERQVV